MKRIILFFITTIIVLSLGASVCYAAEEDEVTVPYVEEIVESEELSEEATEEDAEAVEDASLRMLFERLYEYVEEHKTELLGLIGDGLILIVAVLLKNRVSFIKKETTETHDSQNSVVDVVNHMVDGYNALKQSYDTYGNTEDDRNRVVGAVLAQNAAILEILTMVYTNSKNLPQGVKDLVNLKYANCLKTLEDDEKVKAIVTAVRENIGTTMSIATKIENNTTEV